MAVVHASHDVLIRCDALSVFSFLADGANNPRWREGLRSVILRSGAPGAVGAVYQQSYEHGSLSSIPGTYRITASRSGAELEFAVLYGPVGTRGGYYLSTEGDSTRVRYALDFTPRGFRRFYWRDSQRVLEQEVRQLERLKAILETPLERVA
ncbi:SRPBCC family protein [Arthrobacter sp. RAF14]|uniref:SRPBCC family protein n=1 Tax=Arthrobacter sp. RAF14 TaxID=3233051 RepID=UPI003F910526